jgi:hypothetical protein
MRTTADWDSPAASAIPRVLQWVALPGLDSNVRVMTSSTWASVRLLGVPGRGSSANPSSRSSRKRCRRLPTVGMVIRRSAAISVLGRPCAAARTTRARRASRWAVLGRRAHASSLARSSSVRATGFSRGMVHLRGQTIPDLVVPRKTS